MKPTEKQTPEKRGTAEERLQKLIFKTPKNEPTPKSKTRG